MSTTNRFTDSIAPENLKAYKLIYRNHKKLRINRWLWITALVCLLFLFLPWTQHITLSGNVTTLRQEDRPQNVNTVIAGRIVKWFVKEGDQVNQGDTLIELAEVKDEYFDPALIERTRLQIEAKQEITESYRSKAETGGLQTEAISRAARLKFSEFSNKLKQQEQKIRSDSANLAAVINDLKIKQLQMQRQKVLYDSGIVSLTQLEQRNQALQEALSKKTSSEIQLANAKQEYRRLNIELAGVTQDYTDKILKTKGEVYQSRSQVSGGEGDVAKMQNSLSNYLLRKQLRYVLAPQAGQIINAEKQGLGEIAKEQSKICEIVPRSMRLAAELFVKPVDVTLLQPGQEVRFAFDGYPAIVFSGWPKASSGIFKGRILVIENTVNAAGYFRILVTPLPEAPWPPNLKVGIGMQGIALLKDVPVWYEIWRNLNGFPPEYYKATDKKEGY